MIGTGIGSMFLPWLIGQTFALFGPRTMTTVLFLDVAVILIILLLFSNRRLIPAAEPVGASG